MKHIVEWIRGDKPMRLISNRRSMLRRNPPGSATGKTSVITFLYGVEYQAAAYLLSIFSLRLFFANMGVGKSVFIVNESLFRYSLLTVVLGALTNVGLNYFLIPLYGAVGAITGSMFSFAVSIFIVDLCFKKTRNNQRLMFEGIFTFWKLQNAS